MIYVFLADGFEEIEAIAPIDVLRRAGLTVKTVGVQRTTVVGAHGIAIAADMGIGEVDCEKMTMAILPGGMPGAETLANSAEVCEILRYAASHGKTIGAICAAPMALGRLGLLEGRRAVCYPGFEKYLTGALVQPEESVVVDKTIVTARGPGAAFDFAFRLAEIACGWKTAEKLRGDMQYKSNVRALT